MKQLFLLLLLTFSLLASSLQLQSGSIIAHTEMMLDSDINPTNLNLHAHLDIQENDVTSLRGLFWVEMDLFASNKSDRDEHMRESLESNTYKLATYQISSVTKTDKTDTYKINGKLSFHGVEKDMSVNAVISKVYGSLTLSADANILFSEYGIEMPCMVFMCVRDRVDLKIQAVFK